jgi:hypothetical protein
MPPRAAPGAASAAASGYGYGPAARSFAVVKMPPLARTRPSTPISRSRSR